MNTRTNYSELSFPVIWIGAKGVRISHNILHFRTCDLGLFDDGFRKTGRVVDADLVSRQVASTQRAGYAPPMWGFRFPGLFHILVDYEWANIAPQTTTLDELKHWLIGTQRSSGMYVGMAGSPKAYEREILNLQSYDEIVKFFDCSTKKKTFFQKHFGDIMDG